MNPLLRDLLAPMQYYWVTSQAEYSTDVLFRSPQALAELLPRRFTYSTLYFEAREVMAFLGRKVHGNFHRLRSWFDRLTRTVGFAGHSSRKQGRDHW